MPYDKEFMLQAIEVAKQNIERGGGPFGAVIVKNNEVIASTGNSVTIDNDPTAHAEVNAIRQACQHLNTFDLSGCEIYSSCEPCPMCLSAIYWAHIDTLYYGATKHDAALAGFDDSFIYRELSLPQAARRLQAHQYEGAVAKQPFDIWNAKIDKTEY